MAQGEAAMSVLAKSLFRETPSLVSAEFLDLLLKSLPRSGFQVRFWDGSTWGADRQPSFTFVLKHPGALRSMFLSPSELTLGGAFIYHDFDIEGFQEKAIALTSLCPLRWIVVLSSVERQTADQHFLD